MASSTTRIPRTPAASTRSGACTHGSIAHRRDATRRDHGSAVTTNTERAEKRQPLEHCAPPLLDVFPRRHVTAIDIGLRFFPPKPRPTRKARMPHRVWVMVGKEVQ